MAISAHCIPCEKNNCWIEIDVRDEQNRSFKGQKATLTDATGTSKTVTLKDGPTLVQGFAVGPVTVKLETPPWLKAAQSREALKEGETSQVPAYTDKLFGHDDVKREHIKVTSGDLCLTDPEQPLPEGHKAGQAQPPRFITKHSYVIEVKGYQLNILRIGVFFDGTANNTTKHEEGKAALEDFLAQCSDPLEQERMRQLCIAGAVSFSDTSQANDITNVGKAYDLYQLPQQGQLTVPVYIDGIGTESGQGDSMKGQALDYGPTSSYGKVLLACREKIVSEVKALLKDALPTLECIHKIEFDVFGFSRGASAARQFVNTIDQQADHPLAEAVTNAPEIRLKAGFDWASREDCRIKFVGLFDTVCSSLLEARSVTLTSDCAERVVHLTAKDEWRYFFALTRITNDVEGKKIASNFTELALPGCHSDIGGGYYSRWSLRNPNSDPALTEQKAIKLFQSMEPAGARPEQSSAYQQAMDYAQAKLRQGWGSGVTVLPSPASDPVKGKLNLRIRTLNRPEFGWKKPLEVSITVLLNRVVEGEYSRIPLHVMVEAARVAGVPFREWDKTDKALMLDSGAPIKPRIDLSKLDGHWVSAGTEAGVAKDLGQQLPDDVYRYLRFEYLHHSADDGLVNGANRIKGREARRLISNLEGGK
ncbi:T6SS phospholipase effector Tle1-like catalytic domain-containing protein [Aeromonas hydrophila]|uniref:T6SS phospholipase effector Tle1-like catalytic domain-containing protein n=1 Tax=Aeromonas hydrophila TaxID=644 RepID=UPI003D1E67B3